MKTLKIVKDERYPDYTIVEGKGRGDLELTVDDATARRWSAALKRYDEVQDEIVQHIKQQRPVIR